MLTKYLQKLCPQLQILPSRAITNFEGNLEEIANIPANQRSVIFLLMQLHKRSVPLGENSCKRSNYFIDGKHGMENLNTKDLCKFSWLEKPYTHKKNTVKSN